MINEPLRVGMPGGGTIYFSPERYFRNMFGIRKVIFNYPATIVMWADGTKTVVKCDDEDIYDKETGLLMCIAKKAYGNTGMFNDILRQWVPEDKWEYEEIDPVWAVERLGMIFGCREEDED